MDWHPATARALAELDHSLRPTTDLSPALYEVARRLVYATGDPALLPQFQLSKAALMAGAAALRARCPIVVDVPAIQVALMPGLQISLNNPIYCALEAVSRPQRQRPRVASGMEILAQRYPTGLYVIGQSSSALESLVGLIEQQAIAPAMVIATPPGPGEAMAMKARLRATATPWASLAGSRGGTAIATAFMDALIELVQYSLV
jgi:precorrin-8X/cobalt-precorrin-8 methylmutase